jgi:hypothetical protein
MRSFLVWGAPQPSIWKPFPDAGQERIAPPSRAQDYSLVAALCERLRRGLIAPFIPLRIRGHHMTIQRIETGARMSKVVIHGDTVYLAGFTANKALAGGVRKSCRSSTAIGQGRHRQDQAPARHHLALRHPHRGRHEQGVGRLGAGWLRARARLCRGAAARAGEEGGDSGHGSEVTVHDRLRAERSPSPNSCRKATC